MKPFSQWRKERQKKNEKLPAMTTSMGSHSLKDRPKLKAIETCMGSHSLGSDKKLLKEDILSHDDAEYHKRIHDNVAPMGKLSNYELAAIKNYTDDSRGINNMLYNHHQGKNYAHSHLDSANSITDTLNRHKTKEDVTLYTGVPKSPSEHFNDHNYPVTIHLPAFTSTSSSHRVASTFAELVVRSKADHHHNIEHLETKHVLAVHVPKGSSAASVFDHTLVPSELEVLVNRGHNLKIHPKPEYRHKHGQHVYTWKAELSDHVPNSLDGD